MIGKGEIHSVAYDKVERAMSEVLYEPYDVTIANVIKELSRYGPLLSTRDIETITRKLAKQVEEQRL